MRKVIFIPAHMGSSRLPGKPLLEIEGRPLIQWCYENASRTKADEVYVVSSDGNILRKCEELGMKFVQTGSANNGTERCGAAADLLNLSGNDVVVNLQSDEPDLHPAIIDRLLNASSYSNFNILTAICDFANEEARENRDFVKAIVTNGICRWFSRANMAGAYHHIGIYAYRARVLREISRRTVGFYSSLENLEQLDWIERGWEVYAAVKDSPSISINSPADIRKFLRKLSRQAST